MDRESAEKLNVEGKVVGKDEQLLSWACCCFVSRDSNLHL
jgi:hypothetical protein